ncbi:hypothetical protein Scep_003339 [Stephania cephalantha]|uniref:RRM domain-containing protein n=1 Tax=Stephania cephalantha TaxID=152367 RepID=A0AAP0KSW7_9MAGN
MAGCGLWMLGFVVTGDGMDGDRGSDATARFVVTGDGMDVKLNANRLVVGTLRGFDQFMNLVIDNTMEINGNEKNDIGMVFALLPVVVCTASTFIVPPHGSEVYIEESAKHAELLALPPHGSEVYIGSIPQDTSEEDLKSFCQSVGEVTQVRIMKGKDSGENKGYAFVTFRTKELAAQAIEELNNKEFKVKALYVKNLPKDITQDKLRNLFEHHGEITKVVLPPAKSGQEKSRFGFVHFAERSNAMKALKNTEKYEIDGQVLECSLAKPQTDKKADSGSTSQKSALLPTYPPRMGYGLVGGPYGGLGAGYPPPGLAQSFIYGRGPAPTGMAMMPMLLPDGRIGYVLQQPGANPQTPPPRHRNTGNKNVGKHNNHHNNNNNNSSGGAGRGRRYRPY